MTNPTTSLASLPNLTMPISPVQAPAASNILAGPAAAGFGDIASLGAGLLTSALPFSAGPLSGMFSSMTSNLLHGQPLLQGNPLSQASSLFTPGGGTVRYNEQFPDGTWPNQL